MHFSLTTRPTARDLAQVAAHFAMVAGTAPHADAAEQAARVTANPHLRDALEAVARRCREGSSLQTEFERHRAVFGERFAVCAAPAASPGAATGALWGDLTRHLRFEAEQADRISALTILGGALALTLGGLALLAPRR